FVVREVDEREAARSQHAQDAIVLEPSALGKRLVGLCGHLPYDTPRLPCAFSAAGTLSPEILTRTLSKMIQSMTGYAAASTDSPAGRLSLELRSVNSRFLDLQFRV